MNVEDLSKDYIESVDYVLKNMEIVEGPFTISMSEISIILDQVKDYLEDAKYYSTEKRFEVSLASITYSEGLLDALKMLGVVRFKWSQRKRNVKKR